MEVRPGYKQTEVGVIPKEWECAPIASVARLESGHTPSKRNPSYWGGSIQWVSLHDTAALAGREIGATAKTITEEGLNNSSARLLPPGTVVFSRTATVGKSTVMGTSMATSQDFANYVCGPGLHNQFLVYLFRSMGQTWQRLMAGSIHNTIYMPVFKALKIALPPLSEQHAIADALSDVDALLGGLDRLIAKKRALKQGAMQQLLTGQTRLPSCHGKWEDGRLADVIGALEAGVSVNSVEDDGAAGHDSMCILKTSAVTGGRLIPQECKRIAPRDLSRARINPRKHTLLISRMNTPDLVGECGYVDRDYPNLFVPDRLWMTRFSHDSNASGLWLSYVLSTPMLRRQIGAAATGTSGSMKNLSKQAFLQIPVTFPSLPEQTAIAGVLSDIDTELNALEARREKTCALKQAVMQELLAGKTRLVPAGASHA